MAAKDLITLARAKQNIKSITDSSQDSLLNTLITAISEAIEQYCHRDFTSKSYDELYSGTGDRRLLLREYPIQSVQSVRYRPVTVLKIINNNAATVTQQARASVTSTGLTLVRVNSGIKTTDASVTFAGSVTLQAVVTAVNALGNGWSAQVVGDTTGDYGSWPSADLYVPPSYGDGTQSQGAMNACRVYAELKMHTYELAGFQFDPRGWILRAIPYTDPELLHPEDLIFPVGINNFRVQYTAGYTTIPEAVQEACAEWVAYRYFMTSRDPGLQMQSIPGASTFQVVAPPGRRNPPGHSGGASSQPPPQVAVLLAPYRRYTIGTNQG